MPRGIPNAQTTATPDAFADEHDESNVGVLNRRDDDVDPEALPSLIRPKPVTPVIDLSRPEDSPDRPDGEWSKPHLIQFLARQPTDMVFIPKENWEEQDKDTFQTVGYMGHWFSIRKGSGEIVPIQIAAIIQQSQRQFPTTQASLRKRELTDLSKLPQSAESRGVPGVEVAVAR